jgi:sugar phosphate isomerase/epimerase
VRFSVTTDMFNYSFKPGLEEKLGLFREHNFEYIHWCDDWDNDIRYSVEEISRFKRLLKDVGILCQDVHGTSTSKYRIDTLDAEDRRVYRALLENRVRLCAELGGDCVVVHPPRTEGGELELKLESAITALRGIQKLCHELGIRLAVENCYKGDEFFLENLLSVFEPEFLGICFDSGHANIHGNFDNVFKHGKRLLATHLHDNKGDLDSHQPPFWGTVNWKKVIDFIQSSGYKKSLNLEDTYYNGVSRGSMREFLTTSHNAANRLFHMQTSKD